MAWRRAPGSLQPAIVPNPRGTDFRDALHDLDGHVRLELVQRVPHIFVDLFRTSVQDPDQAHVGSEFFPADDAGARDATEWLQEQGVEGVQIFPPAPSYSPRRRPPGIGYG